jgi:broad specificity phosphatase PhoE
LIGKAAAAMAAVVVVGACGGNTPHDRSITLTFVRHAESEGNASGLINTAVPGPQLTPEGQQQAQQAATKLRGNDYDGIFASTMVRTQQTAAPLSQDLGEEVQIVPGLQEIGAGWFEGRPEEMAQSTLMLAPDLWLRGDRQAAIPGSVDGNQFNDAFSGAVQKIYDSSDNKPVAFSHGAAIMIWTLMNVGNAKDTLLTTHPLPNTGRVVIKGSPTAGWTLVDWDGITDFRS